MKHPLPSPHPRPFSTYYYGPNSRVSEWSRIGRAASLRGAIRAATLHLFDGTYTKAVVYDETSLEIAHLIHQAGGIRISGVFHGQG